MDPAHKVVVIIVTGAIILGGTIGLVAAFLSERKRYVPETQAHPESRLA